MSPGQFQGFDIVVANLDRHRGLPLHCFGRLQLISSAFGHDRGLCTDGLQGQKRHYHRRVSGHRRGTGVALAGRGARLTLAARSADALERTARRCREAGGQAITVPTDVGDEQSCRQMVERAVEQFGGVDVLVNNAGIGMWARFEEVTDLSIYDQIMRINYLGSVYSTYYALPYLKKSRGLIVAVSSLTG